jgi:fibro-slime domain-containing protein
VSAAQRNFGARITPFSPAGAGESLALNHPHRAGCWVDPNCHARPYHVGLTGRSAVRTDASIHFDRPEGIRTLWLAHRSPRRNQVEPAMFTGPILTKPRLIALTAAMLIADSALAQAPTDKFPLKGVIRDFSKTNPNIATPPTGGNGTYSGNISVELGSDGKPVFTGAGYKVATPWLDAQSKVLAPNMYIDPATVGSKNVPLVNMPTIKNNPTIDTYDPNKGPYRATNKGPAPTFVSNSAMPAISVPDLVPSQGDVEYKGNGTTTLSGSFRCKTFNLSNNHTLNISGNVTIVCDEAFVIQNHTKVMLLDGAMLTVYSKKDAKFENNVDINMNTCQSSRFMFYQLGTSNLIIENSARAYCQVVAPNASLHVKNNCDFYGKLCSKSVTIENSGGFHIEAGEIEFCGVVPQDVAGSKGISSTAGIPNAAGFNQWYNDVLGVNLSMPHTILLGRDVSNTKWQFINDAFWPIDKKLKGNESQAHNAYFTWTCSAQFIHHGCMDTFVEFLGKDDMWVFINGKLVMDRGGVIPTLTHHVDMDRLGLNDGQVYTIDLFYAQRNASVSQFRLFTNLDLIEQPQQVVQMSGPMD